MDGLPARRGPRADGRTDGRTDSSPTPSLSTEPQNVRAPGQYMDRQEDITARMHQEQE